VKDRSPFVRGLAVATLLPFAAMSCGSKQSGGGGPTGGPGSASPISDQVLVQSKDLPPGLDLRVSEGKAGPPAFDRDKLAPAKKLADADAQALLSRARPIAKDAADQQAFALRPGSQPAPRTGQTIRARSRRRRRRCCRRARTTPARICGCCAGCRRARCRWRRS
jgi:hypothetical protein